MMSSSTPPGRESRQKREDKNWELGIGTARRHDITILTAVLYAWSPFGMISKDSGAAKDAGKSRAALRRKLNRDDKELEQLQKEALAADSGSAMRSLSLPCWELKSDMLYRLWMMQMR